MTGHRHPLRFAALLALLALGPAFAASVSETTQAKESAMTSEWTSYHPAATGTVPTFVNDEKGLAISCADANGFCSWERDFPAPEGEAVAIRVLSDARPEWNNRVGAVATLKRADGYALSTWYLEPEIQADGTLTFAITLPRRDAATVSLSLYFKWTAGTVLFREVSVTAAPLPPVRRARIVTTRIMPEAPTTREENLARIQRMLDRIAAAVERPDLVLFSECLPDRMDPRPVAERAEPLEGPTFQLLSRWSKANHCYTAISIHERAPEGLYNTAFIVGRQGELVGRYRKCNLTWGESHNMGILPGHDYPVFELDFGKVGMEICWDMWFGEASRALRLNGAEVILLPIAGDGIVPHRDHVWPARALENGVYLVTSATFASHDGRSLSLICDPNGQILAQTSGNDTFTWADLVFPFEKPCRFLSVGDSDGDPRNLYIRERNVEAAGRLQSF